jgi:hypothetical protein
MQCYARRVCNRPFLLMSGNHIETGLLTLHSIVTTLMTTLPFPLHNDQAIGMAGNQWPLLSPPNLFPFMFTSFHYVYIIMRVDVLI